MKEFIVVEKEVRAKIAKTYKVTPECVGMALRFKRNGQRAVAMRIMALENGGVLYGAISGGVDCETEREKPIINQEYGGKVFESVS
ncbi:MAG: hypothetical protein LBR08_10395 [Bacteroidales bacterium]|jgi:hypothetical protein|nr:hypothetical protein [Bacteroidales bacterium]